MTPNAIHTYTQAVTRLWRLFWAFHLRLSHFLSFLPQLKKMVIKIWLRNWQQVSLNRKMGRKLEILKAVASLLRSCTCSQFQLRQFCSNYCLFSLPSTMQCFLLTGVHPLYLTTRLFSSIKVGKAFGSRSPHSGFLRRSTSSRWQHLSASLTETLENEKVR